MRVKKYLALIFAAILATTMLTGCPWEKEEDKTNDASSVPVTSTDTSQDDDDDDGGSGGDYGLGWTPTVASDIQNGQLQVTHTVQNADKTFTITVQAQPSEGFYVDSLTVTADGKTTTWNRSSRQIATFSGTDAGTGITIETTDNKTFTITGIPDSTTSCSISAEFVKYCIVTVNITGNGTVTADGLENDKILVEQGESVSITATPTDESKYGLASVTVGEKRLETVQNGTFTVTPTTDTTVNVTFAPIINTIDISAKCLGTTTWYGCIELQCTSGYTSFIRETVPLNNVSNDQFSAYTTLTDVSFLQGVDALVTVRLKQPRSGGTTVDISKKIEKIQISNNDYQMEAIPVKDNEDHSWTFTIPANQIGNSVWITIADKTAQ